MMTLSVRFVGSCVLLLCTLCIIHSLEHQTADDNDGFDQSVFRIGTERGLEKRALSTAAKIGLAAIEFLLKDAKRIHTDLLDSTRYRKLGTLQTARKDFFSVKPGKSDVMEFGHPKGKLLVRKVGDRQINLLTGGDTYSRGRPILEVIGKDLEGVRIVYWKPKNRAM